MTSSPALAPSPIEARTIRKLRLGILPLVFLFYVMAYLDRIKIGFAALTMNKGASDHHAAVWLPRGNFLFGHFVPANRLCRILARKVAMNDGISNVCGFRRPTARVAIWKAQ